MPIRRGEYVVVEMAGFVGERERYRGTYDDCCIYKDEVYLDFEVEELHISIMQVLEDGSFTMEY